MTSPYRRAPTGPAGPRVPVRWVAREPPLAPCAMACVGEVARALAARLLRMSDAALAEVRGVAGPRAIVVMGAALPWVDGAHHLGRDPAAPMLYLPCALRPHVDAGLFERALFQGPDAPAAPLAIVWRPDGVTAVPLAEALPVSRDRVRAWMEAR